DGSRVGIGEMKMRIGIGVTSGLLCLTMLGAPARAQHEAAEPATPGTPSVVSAEQEARPIQPEDPFWAGPMMIIVLGLFLAAAVVGPIVRSEMAEEPPVSHGHDDDHASAHGDHSSAPAHGHGHH